MGTVDIRLLPHSGLCFCYITDLKVKQWAIFTATAHSAHAQECTFMLSKPLHRTGLARIGLNPWLSTALLCCGQSLRKSNCWSHSWPMRRNQAPLSLWDTSGDLSSLAASSSWGIPAQMSLEGRPWTLCLHLTCPALLPARDQLTFTPLWPQQATKCTLNHSCLTTLTERICNFCFSLQWKEL